MKKSFNFIFAIAALSIVTFISCGKEDMASPTSARVRFFNAVADVPSTGVTLLLNGTPVSLRTYLTAGSMLTDSSYRYGAGFPGITDSSYLYLTSGDHNIKVASPVGAATNVFDRTVSFAAGKTYSVFNIDTLNKMELLVVEDVLPAAKTGKAYIRVAHLAPNTSNVDAMVRYVKTVSGVVTYPDSTAVGAGIKYKDVSSFVEVKAPDSLVVEFRRAGTLTSAVTFPKSAFIVGRCYTIVARGKTTLATNSIIHGR